MTLQKKKKKSKFWRGEQTFSAWRQRAELTRVIGGAFHFEELSGPQFPNTSLGSFWGGVLEHWG